MVEQQAAPLNAVFHALADPTRRAILKRLAKGESSIGELAAPFKMTFAGTSKHIKALERAGLVRRTVKGRTHVCRLDPKPLAKAHDWLRYYEQFWNARLDLLRQLLTNPDQDEGESDE